MAKKKPKKDKRLPSQIKRSETYYYAEWWDKADLRELKIDQINGEVNTKHIHKKFLSGSSSRPIMSDSLYFASFWKTLDGVEGFISRAKKENVSFIIKSLDRDKYEKLCIKSIELLNSTKKLTYYQDFQIRRNIEVYKRDFDPKPDIDSNIYLDENDL